MLCQRNVNRVFPPAVNLGERQDLLNMQYGLSTANRLRRYFRLFPQFRLARLEGRYGMGLLRLDFHFSTAQMD